MKSKIKCNNCGDSFLLDEKALDEKDSLKCPKCFQPLGEKVLVQLKNAFESLHKYQK